MSTNTHERDECSKSVFAADFIICQNCSKYKSEVNHAENKFPITKGDTPKMLLCMQVNIKKCFPITM